MTSRFKAEKFTGRNDFGLWRMKMKAMLVQQGLSEALKSEASKGKEEDDPKVQAKKEEVLERTHSAIILCLADNVLREVAKETTAAGVWSRLEALYMTKSLANRLYMKQRLYSYKFIEEKGIGEQLEDFNKAIDDMENVDVSLEDEDKAILLLNALSRSYDQLRDVMLYGRENSISLVEVQSALKAKELQNGGHKDHEKMAESLSVEKFRGKKPFKKGTDELKNKLFQKGGTSDQKETRSCFWYKKPGQLKKECFAWKRKHAEGAASINNTDCLEESESPEILNIMEKSDKDSWIMDTKCSFHMCPNKRWFQNPTQMHGSVLLGNNQVCNIQKIGNIKLKMHDGSIRLLADVRYIPKIKRNLISLGMLELRGCSFTSSDGRMEVKKGAHTVMIAERKHNLYYISSSCYHHRISKLSK